MFRPLNVTVKDSVYDPFKRSDDVIQFRRPLKGAALYRVNLYLDGDDLIYVQRATYRLHPTFDPPLRTVERTVRNPNCLLEIWTWGLFEVEVNIEDKSGGLTRLTHDLSYSREITAAPKEKFRLVS